MMEVFQNFRLQDMTGGLISIQINRYVFEELSSTFKRFIHSCTCILYLMVTSEFEN